LLSAHPISCTCLKLFFFGGGGGGFFSTLLSIHDFMLKAAQTKWISRLVAKTSIQDALMQFDQQLRDAAMSFQVRRVAVFTTLFLGDKGVKLSVGRVRFLR
jgi:hypothetical protein